MQQAEQRARCSGGEAGLTQLAGLSYPQSSVTPVPASDSLSWEARVTSIYLADYRQPRVVAVIPAYNEDRFIGSVVLKSLPRVDALIVVDDGSADQTAAVATEAGAHVIRHGTNRGKGAALRTGFAAALDMGADVVVTFDGDGQHDPRQIPAVLAPLFTGEADLVIGSRFMDMKNHIPVWRQFGQHVLTWATNAAAGVRASDSQSGFRAFSRQMLEGVVWQSDGFAVECEMQFWAREHNLRIQEVAISCLYVEKPKRNPFFQALQVFHGLLKLTSEARPLMFFGLLGLLAFLGGICWGWWLFQNATLTGELQASYALLATTLIIIGALASFEAITLHTLRKIMVRVVDDPTRRRVASSGTADSLAHGDPTG
jgi:glycosyltransferase involved in cell wall biosynthesis